MKGYGIIILIYFFFLFSAVNINAQPLTGVGITGGLLINHLYSLEPQYYGCLGCQIPQVSDLQTMITTGGDFSANYQWKLSNTMGLYTDLGLMYAHARFNYHVTANWVETGLDANEQDSYHDSYESETVYNDIYLHVTVALHFYVDKKKRIYLYAGIRPALVVDNFSSDTCFGTLQTTKFIYPVVYPATTSGLNFTDTLSIDHRFNVEAVAGIGIQLGKPQTSRFAVEVGGFNGFVRYWDSVDPSLKRDGLELKILYRLKK